MILLLNQSFGNARNVFHVDRAAELVLKKGCGAALAQTIGYELQKQDSGNWDGGLRPKNYT